MKFFFKSNTGRKFVGFCSEFLEQCWVKNMKSRLGGPSTHNDNIFPQLPIGNRGKKPHGNCAQRN